ncbi:hypothetical protein N2W52_001978 [Clostridium perfringens]|nr:hypothetical protein [Clostridium perfringens]MDK0982995.1 hypothetical protein [Clostridium perfringens]
MLNKQEKKIKLSTIKMALEILEKLEKTEVTYKDIELLTDKLEGELLDKIPCHIC